jgi:hypothetical protein
MPETGPETTTPSHRRRNVVLGIAVLVLVAAALVGGREWGGHGHHSVWTLRHDLAAGTVLRSGDLVQATVVGAAATPLVPASRTIVGQPLNRSLPAGAGVPTAALGGLTAVPHKGQELVGVALAPGDAPTGLEPGVLVTVLELPATGNAQQSPSTTSRVLLPLAELADIQASSNGNVATLVVPAQLLPTVAALSAQQRIAVTATAAGR